MRKQWMVWCAASVQALVLGGNVQAHDAWIEVQGNPHAIRFGHHQSTQSFSAVKVKRVTALGRDGERIAVTVQPLVEGAAVLAPAQAALLVLEFDNGYWSKRDGRSHNIARSANPGSEQGSHALKFGKTVLSWSEALTQPVGARLELVPKSSQPPRAGESLVLMALFEGQALPGAVVTIGQEHGGPSLRTDARGEVRVPVQQGLNMVGVEYSIRGESPDDERISLAANLRFEVRP